MTSGFSGPVEGQLKGEAWRMGLPRRGDRDPYGLFEDGLRRRFRFPVWYRYPV